MHHHTDGWAPYGDAFRMHHHTDGWAPYGDAFRMHHHAGLPVWELPCDYGKDLPKFSQYSVLGSSSHMGTRLGWRELNWSAAQLGLGWSSHMGTRGQLSESRPVEAVAGLLGAYLCSRSGGAQVA